MIEEIEYEWVESNPYVPVFHRYYGPASYGFWYIHGEFIK